jgi:hypothetical protein
MAVVGNGNIDVGNQTPTRSPDQSIVERLVGGDGSSEPPIDKPLQTGTISICGAMSLQGGDGGRGNESVPQKIRAPGRLPRSQSPARAIGSAAAGPNKTVVQGRVFPVTE